MIVGLEQDLRSAVRQLVRWPGLTLVAVLSLAGPMGLNTSLFSLFNAAWLRPWDVDDVAQVRIVLPRVSVEEWRDWAAQTRTFGDLAAVTYGAPVTLRGRRLRYAFVSASYFDALRVPVARGQGFSSRDDHGGVDVPPAVVSHRLWQSVLEGDRDILGKVLTLAPASVWQERVSVRVVGVGPPGFDGTGSMRTHLWLPLAATRRFPAEAGSGIAGGQVSVVGRLAPRISSGEAQAELSALSGRFRSGHGLEPAPILVRGTAHYSHSPPSPQAQLTVTVLLIGVGLIAFVACANVANLQLARGHARSGEIAVRLSLGATRGRIARELLTEAFLMAIVAGLLGLAIASWMPTFLMHALFDGSPDTVEMPRLEAPLDGRVLAWAMLASTLACLGFGLAPALHCARISVGRALHDAHSQSTRPLRTSLLSAQAIVSAIALALAGFMARSADFGRTRELDARLRDLTVVQLELSHAEDSGLRQSANDALWQRLARVVGPGNVAGLTSDPLVARPGAVHALGVSPGYFDFMGMSLVAGRGFLSATTADRVLVVNEAFAHRFWPGDVAIGRAFLPDPEQVTDSEIVGREVIGVVRDRGIIDSAAPVAYYPGSGAALRVFLARDPDRKAWRGIASFMERTAPGVETSLRTGREWAGALVGPLLVSAQATAAFGLLAVVLGGLGFFTLSEYAVRQRTREIGVRVALGAGRRDVLGAVLRPATLALTRGLLIGGAGAIILGFTMQRAQLPAGVDPLDPVLYAGVATILGLVGISAAWVPARRALAIEPSEALRRD